MSEVTKKGMESVRVQCMESVRVQWTVKSLRSKVFLARTLVDQTAATCQEHTEKSIQIHRHG